MILMRMSPKIIRFYFEIIISVIFQNEFSNFEAHLVKFLEYVVFSWSFEKVT